MRCIECDRLDDKQIGIRKERVYQQRRGILTPEREILLESREFAVLAEIQDHKANDHQQGETYD